MPKQVELKVIVSDGESNVRIHPEYLRLGDRMAGGREVVAIDTKVKYAHITLEGEGEAPAEYRRNTVRLPIGSEVNVTREEATEDEVLASKIEVAVAELKKRHERSHKASYALFTQLLENYQGREVRGDLFSFDLERAAELAYAQRVDAVWRNLYHTVEYLTESGKAEDVAWLMATQAQRDKATAHLTRGFRRVLSRSTSVIGNIEEDLMEQAYGQFLDDTKYMRVSDLLKQMGEML